MAFSNVFRLVPVTAFQGHGRLRAAGVRFESWLASTGLGVSTGTITCNKITHPQAVMVFDNSTGAAVTPSSITIVANASGTSTVAFTGLAESSNFTIWIRGGV